MEFPRTLNELKAKHYIFKNDSRCKGCGAEIEWWLTPNMKWIPINPMSSGEDEVVVHWVTCECAEDFRKNRHP